MNIFADEGVDRQIVERLRQAGHSVPYVAEMAPGISDNDVLGEANRSGMVLMTQDKDFGELVFRQRLVAKGVILLRLAGLSNAAKAETVSLAVQQHGTEFENAFTVISPGVVRVRHRPN